MARSGFTGATKAEGTARLAVAARWAQRIPLPQQLSRPDDPTVELVTFDDGAIRGEHFFADDATLPDPDHTVRVGAAEVTVTAGVLLRDLALFPDRIHPESTVDEMLVTLLPRRVGDVPPDRPGPGRRLHRAAHIALRQ